MQKSMGDGDKRVPVKPTASKGVRNLKGKKRQSKPESELQAEEAKAQEDQVIDENRIKENLLNIRNCGSDKDLSDGCQGEGDPETLK